MVEQHVVALQDRLVDIFEEFRGKAQTLVIERRDVTPLNAPEYLGNHRPSTRSSQQLGRLQLAHLQMIPRA